MNDYKGQPLIYVASNSQRAEVKGDNDFYADKSVIFVGNPRIIDTHGTVYYCASQNVDDYISGNDTNITNINTEIASIKARLNNIDGNGNSTLAQRISHLESIMDQLFPMDGDDENNRADFIDQLWQAIEALLAENDTIITTINNNISDIDFWYTYGELQSN